MTHDLKIVSPHYENQRDRLKPWELRKNDRDFKAGDWLRLHHFDPEKQANIDSPVLQVMITHVHTGFGLADGYALLTTFKP